MQINKSYVKLFYKSLVKCNGNLHEAASYADRKFDLNWCATPCETDSWHEALSDYKNNFVSID